MKALVAALAALAIGILVGCTMPEPSSPPPAGGALPPPEGLEEPDTAGAPAAPAGETGAGGTGGESGTVVETIKPEPSEAQEPSAIAIPEGSGWTNPGVPLTQQQLDIESCFNYADAQIKSEAQIDDDRFLSGNDRDFENQYGLNTFRQRVDYYSERRRRGALFDSCMESKGYTKE
jgi:hypothetical protein